MGDILNNLSTPVSLVVLAIYVLIIAYACVNILLNTDSSAKTLAYLLLIFIAPVIGVLFYFSFGANLRHRKSHKKGTGISEVIKNEYIKHVKNNTNQLLREYPDTFKQFSELARFIDQLGAENLGKNEFKLLVNGEEKFPEVLSTLKTAEQFIHMEYYDWENDQRGNQIKEVLLDKVSKGVKVRVLYDDYASRGIKKNIVKQLRAAGVEIHPVIKVKLAAFANRMNHRDHRKLIIMDGHTGFIGGINISDRYDNSIDTGLYWRDTHVKITGQTVLNMQRHFITNWNAVQKNQLSFTEELFPHLEANNPDWNMLAQVVAGGPVYPMSNIMLTYVRLFSLARHKLYITNPYFIPNDSILDALKQAAISGVDVRLMMPMKSDSAIVGAAAKFYYKNLLLAGVKIYLYRKGFVHAKTVIADSHVSIIGTANMDIRSFDLNFELMSVNYNQEFAEQFERVFLTDLEECDQIDVEAWLAQSKFKQLTYAVARLTSAFL